MLVRDLPTSMNYERDTAGREALQAFLRDNIDIDQLKEALAGTANTSIKNTRTQDATRPKKESPLRLSRGSTNTNHWAFS
mmetsp:Transcript_6766/g.9554  ORF Transcript_6766/g.9554 Transcript_6766/m.9554 type:complete len:80 (-) Transcript_6766:235-474(-)